MLPRFIAENFYTIQLGLAAVAVVYILLTLSGRRNSSQFRSREFERTDLDKIKSGPSIADAKIKKPSAPPLSLPGIRLQGEPHEILGVDINADEATIMRAYKEAIKRYHPDRLQNLSPQDQKFYQEAAAKLNEAKERLLKKS